MTDMNELLSQKPHLLIIDDEEDVAKLIAEVADGLGFLTKMIYDGAAFQDAYHRHRPHAIILDLNLPKVDGIELLRFLGQQSCQAKVFIASGVDSRTLAAATSVGKQLNLDIVGSLPKPLMVEDIEQALTPLAHMGNGIGKRQISEALANGEMQVRYQPKVDLMHLTGTRMSGVEALVRWIPPTGSMIYPDEFLPAAQECGLMSDLTDVVAEQALQATRTWHDLGLDITTSINLDGTMLDDLVLPDRLYDMTLRTGVDPGWITFELTESAAMADAAATMEILTRLRVKGFNVAIDDFGTGYSSLVQLYRLPFNELKIDKSFVMDIGRNKEAGIIVETLAVLGKKLGLTVCAEGIETQAMLDHVRNCGCDLGQGYLFSKPVEAEMVTSLARHWTVVTPSNDQMQA